MSDLADVIHIDINTTGIESLDRASRALDNLGISATGLASNFASLVGDSTIALFETIAHTAELATLALGGIGLASVGLAGSFEANMNKVKYLTTEVGENADVTAARMTALQRAAIEIGMETTFSSNQAAAGQAILAQMHYNTNQIIAMGLPIARAAMDNNLDMKDVTLTLTGVMNAFNFKTEDTGRVLDMMAQATRMGRMTFMDFGAETSRVGAIAQRLGVNLEDLTAQQIALENNTTTARQSGMLLGSVYMQLLAPTEKQAKVMQALGISYRDASGNMKPLQQIAGEVMNSVQNLSRADQDAVDKVLFLSNGFKTFSSILGAHYTTIKDGIAIEHDGVDAVNEMAKTIHNSAGTLQRASDTILSGFNARMLNLAGSAREAGIAIGLYLLPGLSSIVLGVIHTINDFIKLELYTHLVGKAFEDAGIILSAFFAPLATWISATVIQFAGFMLVTDHATKLTNELAYAASILGQALMGGLSIAFVYVSSIVTTLLPILYDLGFNMGIVLGTTVTLTPMIDMLKQAFQLLGTVVGTIAGTILTFAGGVISVVLPAIAHLNFEFQNGIGVGGALRNIFDTIVTAAFGLGTAIGNLILSVGHFVGALLMVIDRTHLVFFAVQILEGVINTFGIVFDIAARTIALNFDAIVAAVNVFRVVFITVFNIVEGVIIFFANLISIHMDRIIAIMIVAGQNIIIALNIIQTAFTNLEPAISTLTDAFLFLANIGVNGLHVVLTILTPVIDFITRLLSMMAPIIGIVVVALALLSMGFAAVALVVGTLTVALSLLTAAIILLPIAAVIFLIENWNAVIGIISNTIGDIFASAVNFCVGMINHLIDAINLAIISFDVFASAVGITIPMISHLSGVTMTHAQSTIFLLSTLHFTIPALFQMASTANYAAGALGNSAGAAYGAAQAYLAAGVAALRAAANIAVFLTMMGQARASFAAPPTGSNVIGALIGIGTAVAPILHPVDVPSAGVPGLGGGGGGGGGSPSGGGGGAAPKDPLQEALDLADKLGKAAEALSKINQYYAVSDKALKDFNSDMTKLIMDFVAGATKFGVAGLKGAADYADAAGKIADAAGKMADTLAKIRTYSQIAKGIIDLFVGDVDKLVQAFVTTGAKYTVAMYQTALYFAETSSRVADASSKMADALAKVRGWAGVANESIIGFVYNVEHLMLAFYNASLAYTNKMQDGMKSFSDTTVKVADGVSKMADALKKILDWSGVADVSVIGFVYNVSQIVKEYYTASLAYTEDMNIGLSRFADTSIKVADSAGKMADSLKKMLDWVGVANVSIIGFVYNVTILVDNYRNASYQYTVDMLDSTDRFTKTSDLVATSAGKMADALVKVNEYSVVAGDAINLFGINVSQLVTAYYAHSGGYTTGMLAAIDGYSVTSGKVADAAAKAFGVFKAFPDYVVVAGAAIVTFGENVKQLTDAFKFNASTYDSDTTTGIGLYGDAANKVVTAMAAAMKLFTDLKNFQGVAPDAVQGLINDMILTVNLIQTLVTDAQIKMLPKAVTFGEMVGKLFAGMDAAMKWFTDMQKFIGVGPKAIQNFIDDVMIVVDKVTALKILADTILIGEVTAFGVAIGSIFTGLKGAMDVFSGLEKYKSIAPKVIDDFLWSITYTVNQMDQVNTLTLQTLMPSAHQFASDITTIFTALKDALTLFDDLSKVKDSPANAIRDLIIAMGTAIENMVALDGKAVAYLEKANNFNASMQAALAAVIAGMNAQQQAAAISNGQVPGTVGPTPGQPGTPPGPATGGKVFGDKPYKVGEYGPEWFIPNRTGFIADANITKDLDSRGNGGSSSSQSINIASIIISLPNVTDSRNIGPEVQKNLYALFRNAKQLEIIGGV